MAGAFCIPPCAGALGDMAMSRVLGRGAYGECRIAIDEDTGMLFALKTVQVSGSRSEVAELVRRPAQW